jgi:hypothetical protein
MLRSAAAAGLTRLYHYEKFNPDYLADVLVNHRVHCSDLANLNDPWDCKPWFDAGAFGEPSVVDDLIEWIFSMTPTGPVSEDEVLATQEAIRSNPAYRQAVLERLSRDFVSMIPNRWRVYCLTPVPDSTLMWSHYAQNHKGMCLEFGLEHPAFGSALEVEYLSSYPRWAPHSLTDKGSLQILLSKSDDWKYEREYRIIGLGEKVARPLRLEEGHPLMLKGDFLGVPEGCLKALIAGCEADYVAIKDIVHRLAPDLKVKRAVRSPARYRLEIVDDEVEN